MYTKFYFIFRSAMAKMKNIQIAANYLKERSKWPILNGYKLHLKPDTRLKHKKKVSSDTSKIYDDVEECISNESSDCIEDNKSD